MMEKGTTRARLLAVLAAAVVFAAACTTPAGTAAPRAAAPSLAPPSGEGSAAASPSGGGAQYRIGYSNGGGVGNGFREEQVCTAKAESLASGRVSELITIHRNTDAAGQ